MKYGNDWKESREQEEQLKGQETVPTGKREKMIISSKEVKTQELMKPGFEYVKSVAWKKGIIYLLMSICTGECRKWWVYCTAGKMQFRQEINPFNGEGREEQLQLALGSCKVSSIQEQFGQAPFSAFGQELFEVQLAPRLHRNYLSWPLKSHATLDCNTRRN